jgi:hypothetical protein
MTSSIVFTWQMTRDGNESSAVSMPAATRD